MMTRLNRGTSTGRVVLALKGTESIWAEIKVVILTMQNPFGLRDPDGDNTGLLQKKKKKKIHNIRGGNVLAKARFEICTMTHPAAVFLKK